MTPPSSAPAVAHQRRKAERPQELLDAALALFVERGFAATRTEEVAQRAGVSKGTLYLYYPSKEDLLKAVIRHFLSSQISAGAELAKAHGGSASELLRDVLMPWWLQVVNSPASGVFKLVITEVRNFPEIADFYRREVVEPGQQVIRQIVQRGIESGEFQPLDANSAVFSILFPMVMLCLHRHSLGACLPDQPQLDPAHFVHAHFDLLLQGMLARP
ncbi:MAG: TetR/AcrR family transcriptional regulator [Burkholderiales bacterium]